MTTPFAPNECKDVAFARNLIKQMDEGYGRHNSTKMRPHFRRSESPGLTAEMLNRCVEELSIFQREMMGTGEWHVPRVIGRLCDGSNIVEKFEHAAVGDFVKDRGENTGATHIEFCPRRVFNTAVSEAHPDVLVSYREIWCFERVRVMLIHNHEETFWKRIE